MDRLHIRDLTLRCVIGVDERERRERQDVVLQITLHADLRRACGSDRFEDTVDYRALKKRVVALVEGSQFRLIEALAEAVARTCFEDERVVVADVTVEKPGALRFARTVAAQVVRRRDEQ